MYTVLYHVTSILTILSIHFFIQVIKVLASLSTIEQVVTGNVVKPQP